VTLLWESVVTLAVTENTEFLVEFFLASEGAGVSSGIDCR
jgi:hypothetical protein